MGAKGTRSTGLMGFATCHQAQDQHGRVGINPVATTESGPQFNSFLFW